MAHATVKSILVPEIVRMISEHDRITEEEAMDRFYHSVTSENLDDDETGLYSQSALYIYGLYVEEQNGTLTTPPCPQ